MNEELIKIDKTTIVKAYEIRITDKLTLDWANDILMLCKAAIDEVNAKYKPDEEKIKRETVDLRSHKATDLAIPEQVRKYLDPKVAKYLYDENQKRIKAKADVEAQAAAKKKLDDDLKRAEEAEKKGDTKEADIIMEKAAVEEMRIVPTASAFIPPAVKAEGQGVRENWKARVINLRLLLEAVITGKVSIEAVSPYMPYLNGLASKFKEEQHREWGIEFYNEPYTVRSRTSGTGLA